jgi:hypothetical protein
MNSTTLSTTASSSAGVGAREYEKSRRKRTMSPRRPPAIRRRSAMDPRTRTAFHEAGHAVLSGALNDTPHHMSIRSECGTLGRSGQTMLAQPIALAQVYLAGFAAEHVATGRRPRQFDIETGLGILAHVDPGLVERILSTVWPSVRALAEALLELEEIDRDGIRLAIGDADISTPVVAVQRAHGLLRPLRFPPARPWGTMVETAMPIAKKPSKEPRPAPASDTTEKSDPRIARLLSALRADPKVASVVQAYEKDAVKPGRKFGKNGLKTKGGKLFALFTQGTLVVKLPKERVVALVEQGVGKPFDPGHGRLTKEWLTVTSAKASWVELAREAFAFMSGER